MAAAIRISVRTNEGTRVDMRQDSDGTLDWFLYREADRKPPAGLLGGDDRSHYHVVVIRVCDCECSGVLVVGDGDVRVVA